MNPHYLHKSKWGYFASLAALERQIYSASVADEETLNTVLFLMNF
jgi:hypothetical protein